MGFRVTVFLTFIALFYCISHTAPVVSGLRNRESTAAAELRGPLTISDDALLTVSRQDTVTEKSSLGGEIKKEAEKAGNTVDSAVDTAAKKLGLSRGAIIAIAVGAVVIVILLLLCICCCCCCRK